MTPTCATCKHWTGDDLVARAPCGLPDNTYNAPSFNDTCRRWEGKVPPPPPSPLDAPKKTPITVYDLLATAHLRAMDDDSGRGPDAHIGLKGH